LRGLDRYDWLRAKALEAWPEAESSDDELAVAFLARTPGWTERLAAAVEVAVAADAAEGERGTAARIADLERAAAEARRKAREERGRARAERERLTAQRDEARTAARAVRGEEERSEAALRRRVRRADERVEAAEAEVGVLRREVADLREKLAAERRRRAAAEHAAAEAAAGRGWVTGDDPEALAVHLDDVARMARPLAPDAKSGEEAPEPLELPDGVAPDSAAAVDWLLERRDATAVIVDGYNAGFALAGPGEPATVRRRLQLAVSPLPRLASGPLRVLLVYDAPLGAGEEGPSGGRVATCFASGSADDEIVALVGRLPGAVVVISGDREVRERAEEGGALGLWSGALTQWATRR
jgi:hypothetical protein